jgi:hypothetical protein
MEFGVVIALVVVVVVVVEEEEEEAEEDGCARLSTTVMSTDESSLTPVPTSKSFIFLFFCLPCARTIKHVFEAEATRAVVVHMVERTVEKSSGQSSARTCICILLQS